MLYWDDNATWVHEVQYYEEMPDDLFIVPDDVPDWFDDDDNPHWFDDESS